MGSQLGPNSRFSNWQQTGNRIFVASFVFSGGRFWPFFLPAATADGPFVASPGSFWVGISVSPAGVSWWGYYDYGVNLASGIIVSCRSGLGIMVFLKRLAKILLLLIGLLPIIYFVLFMVLVGPGNYSKEPSFILFFWITLISVPCLLVFYIVDCWRNSRVAKNQKALWNVVLLAGQHLAFPVYWYLYLWRQTETNKW